MKIKLLHPLISCICITDRRTDMLLKTILNFEQQNYPNTELVISYPEGNEETKKVIKHILSITDLRILEIERKQEDSIGKARNDAAAICNGDYVCMWDDDDLYQYNRIADQHNMMKGNGRYFQASIITQIILFDLINHKAYQSFDNYWGGTLLCKKEHFLKYPCQDTNHFECEPVINFLRCNKLLLTNFSNPYLYIYVYHGSNIIEYFHFQYYTKLSGLMNETFSQDVQRYLHQTIKINVS